MYVYIYILAYVYARYCVYIYATKDIRYIFRYQYTHID